MTPGPDATDKALFPSARRKDAVIVTRRSRRLGAGMKGARRSRRFNVLSEQCRNCCPARVETCGERGQPPPLVLQIKITPPGLERGGPLPVALRPKPRFGFFVRFN